MQVGEDALLYMGLQTVRQGLRTWFKSGLAVIQRLFVGGSPPTPPDAPFWLATLAKTRA